MKILYDGKIYASQRAGGINRYFANIIQRLPDSDQPVLTAIRHPLLQFPAHPRLKVYRYKRFRFNSLSSALEKGYFRTIESRSKFDLAHPTYYSLLTQREMSEYSIPLVITVYDMIHERYPQMFPSNDETIEAKRKAILSAQAVLCISHSTKRDLLDYYNIPEEKITVTHLATDFNISQSYGAEPVPTQPYFLYVGGRAGYKNFDFLLEAFAKVVSVRPDVKLCVTGSPFSSAEKQAISDLALGDSIYHVGYATDAHLAKLYRCSVAFVYPSLYEGFGIPPLEAMACGGVVVASESSSIPEVLGEAGLLLSPTAVYDWADALLSLLDHPEMREQLITRGSQQIQKFSWDKTAIQTQNIYQSVISSYANT